MFSILLRHHSSHHLRRLLNAIPATTSPTYLSDQCRSLISATMSPTHLSDQCRSLLRRRDEGAALNLLLRQGSAAAHPTYPLPSSLGYSSKLVSGISSLKGGLGVPCERTRSFSSISGGPGMAKTDSLDQPSEKERRVPMSRSMWKGPFVDAFLLRMKRRKEDISNKKIWSRRSVILPEYVNCSVRIYNGKTFLRRKITEGMVGHKFGEFAMTRKRRLLRQNAAANKKKGKR